MVGIGLMGRMVLQSGLSYGIEWSYGANLSYWVDWSNGADMSYGAD